MEQQSVFRFSFDSPVLYALFVKTAKWIKAACIISLLWTVVSFDSALRSFARYSDYADTDPSLAYQNLTIGIVVSCILLLGIVNVFINYRCAKKLESAYAKANQDELIEYFRWYIISTKLACVSITIQGSMELAFLLTK